MRDPITMRDPDWDASDKDAAEHYVLALKGLKVGGGIEREVWSMLSYLSDCS